MCYCSDLQKTVILFLSLFIYLKSGQFPQNSYNYFCLLFLSFTCFEVIHNPQIFEIQMKNSNKGNFYQCQERHLPDTWRGPLPARIAKSLTSPRCSPSSSRQTPPCSSWTLPACRCTTTTQCPTYPVPGRLYFVFNLDPFFLPRHQLYHNHKEPGHQRGGAWVWGETWFYKTWIWTKHLVG